MELDRLSEAANLDPEFRIAARLWTAAIRLERGGDAQLVRVEDGRIESVGPAGDRPGDVCIRGPVEGWQELLAELPRPFYQDLWGAVTHHGFEFDGDNAYYPAVRRLIELMRETR